MFSLESAELKNFKSYRGEHRFEFPTRPGLYLITGQNLANPRLEANGVGKSTLLDAVHWALYGRTSRGLRAADVVSWSGKGCSVTVYVAVAGQRRCIKRTQSPNSLELDGQPVDQAAIDKFLRLNEESFDYAVMIPQFGTSFLDLTPANKLSLFTKILELDYWLERSTLANTIAAEIRATNEANQRKLAHTKGEIESAQDMGVELALKNETFLLDQATRRTELEGNIKFSQERAVQSKKLKAAAQRKLDELLKQADKCPTCGTVLPVAKDQQILQQNVAGFERDIAHLLMSINLDKARLEDIEDDNPYTSLIAKNEKDIVTLKANQYLLEALIEKDGKESVSINYWISGFKHIRLMILDQTLKLLELEVNNNLAALGLLDWSIEFAVERETKAGTVSKGFSVFVRSPHRDDPVRFEAWSGGETQRLRLAGELGLANLIMERAGLRSSIEFYDEPSQHLSQQGLLDLAETLAHRAITDNKIIFLVDHHAIEFGDFTGILNVTKDEEGSHLTWK